MDILQSLKELLKFQKSATISEISQIAEVKKSDVLRVLNLNSSLLIRHNKKPNTITQIVDFRHAMVERAYRDGKVYKVHDRDQEFGYKTITCNNKKVDVLKEKVYAGLYGNVYHIISFSDKNIAKLKELGIMSVSEYLATLPTLEEYWKWK